MEQGLKAMVLAASVLSSARGQATERPFDLQGHRGARGLAPENTLVAFARALSLGVTTLELDLAVTRDGVVVVSHDPVLNSDLTRGPSGKWLEKPGPPIFALGRAELLTYDVGRLRPGSAYGTQFPDQLPADGVRIPTLRDVYALARKAGNDTVRFNIETKIDPGKPEQTLPPEPFADAVLKVVHEAGMAARTTIQSFDWRTLRHVQKVSTDIETVCLTAQDSPEQLGVGRPGTSPWLAGLDLDDFGGSLPRLVKAAGGRVWSPRALDLTPELLGTAHDLGLRVIPWTVNRPEDMRLLIDLGVDGLITDRPDLLRRVMEEKGLPVPKPTPVEP